jgi:hypothetical protein
MKPATPTEAWRYFSVDTTERFTDQELVLRQAQGEEVLDVKQLASRSGHRFYRYWMRKPGRRIEYRSGHHDS